LGDGRSGYHSLKSLSDFNLSPLSDDRSPWHVRCWWEITLASHALGYCAVWEYEGHLRDPGKTAGWSDPPQKCNSINEQLKWLNEWAGLFHERNPVCKKQLESPRYRELVTNIQAEIDKLFEKRQITAPLSRIHCG
jgi:hypothetical protein